MKPDKLQKILEDLETRLRRTEQQISVSGNDRDQARQILSRISTLKANIRRHLSKSDSITLADVQGLETQIELLRSACEDNLSPADRDAFSRIARSIFNDEIGLLRLTSGLKIGLNLLGPGELLDATPGQKTAAFKFAYKNDVLVVVDQPLQPNLLERVIAESAVDTVIGHGLELQADLEGTNVSPRLLRAFTALQTSLEARSNIVQVGQRSLICGRMLNAEIDELSSSLAAMLIGHLEMVSNTLAQFEDWRLYCENAVSLSVSDETVIILVDSAKDLASSLKDVSDVSASVTDALETVSSWAEGPKPDKRDILSLARTLENFWSESFKSVLRFLKDVAFETRQMAVTGVAAALVGYATVKMVPALSLIPGAEWVLPAYMYLKSLSGGGDKAP